jgi:SAM-dependent methyltransferase
VTAYQKTEGAGLPTRGGSRECAGRWALLEPALRRFRRRFSVLDLGAAEGYFALRAARDFDAVAVGLEASDAFAESCREVRPERVVSLRARVAVEDLEELAACEHFDVVLALSFVHHFPDPIRALRAVLNLGDVIVVEIPDHRESGATNFDAIGPLLREAFKLGGHFFAEAASNRSTLGRLWFRFTRQRSLVALAGWGAHRSPEPAVVLSSTRDAKTAAYSVSGLSAPWVEGVGLQTFLALGGTWPENGPVVEPIKRCRLGDGLVAVPEMLPPEPLYSGDDYGLGHFLEGLRS